MSAVSESICDSTYEAERLGRSACWLHVALAADETPEPGWRAMGVTDVVNGENCELFKHVERHTARVRACDTETTAQVIEDARRADLESWFRFARP